MKHAQKGFTLLEVVLAILLLAVMSVMGWQAVAVVLKMNERSRSDLVESMDLQQTWAQLGNDLFQLRGRAYHDGLGGIEPAYVTGQGDVRLSFSRAGAAARESNPTGLTRVEYRLTSQGELIRRAWPVFSGLNSRQVREYTLLEEVDDIRFEQLDAGFFFTPNWPPLNEQRSLESVPPMIRVTLVHEGESSTRAFPGLPGLGMSATGGGDES